MSAPWPREQVAAILGGILTAGSFSARRTAPPDDLRLEVRGVGRLQFPVPDAQARQLRAVARPASYGKGELTLLDPQVRDTWQIPLSRVKIDKRRWNRTLQPVVERLGSDLGLAAGARLRAELQSMLVYTRGQFFVPHQDSEKADEMVASLVVTLPGRLTGGALRVTHRGETSEYRSSKQALSFVAFYADCRHEVRPVRSGNRIVLTYNLLLAGDTAVTATRPPHATVDAMAEQIRAHFLERPRPRWSGDARTVPDRLVYLLDHEYTKRGLNWARLKGADAGRVAVLRAAAERAGCESVLALADVHETWSCGEDDWGRGGNARRGWNADDSLEDDDDDGDGYDGDADEHELDELLESTVTLTHLSGPSGELADPIASEADDVEVCAVTPSVRLEPYESEYEGYMGNYGNTVDRWYHRGAVVLWPRERAFAVHSQASPRWALAAMTEPIRAGDLAAARDMAATLASFWDTSVRADQRDVITTALEVATALDEPDLAAMLLRPFHVESLTPVQAPAFVALVGRYGQAWADALLAGQMSRTSSAWSPGASDRSAWVASVAELCRTLHAADPAIGTVAARLLLRHASDWLRAKLMGAVAIDQPSRRDRTLAGLATPILGLLAGTATIAAQDLRDELVAALVTDQDDALLGCLTQVLRNRREPCRRRCGWPPGWTPSHSTARVGYGRGWLGRRAPPRTGRYRFHADAAVTCAAGSRPSSPTRHSDGSSGRSPRPGAGTYMGPSSGLSCRSATRHGVRAGPTRSC